MDKPWIISVLSTDYDLKDYRKSIISMLKEKGFEVSAFELPEFPVEPDRHSHDSCLDALDRVDIALVIINKRCGGLYCGIEEKKQCYTITETEYLKAIEKRIPVFAFVRRETFNELNGYKKEFREYCKRNGIEKDICNVEEKEKEFEKTYVCKYVDNVKTLKFVDIIQKSFTKYSVSNWMDFFADIDELKDCIEGKLKAYSRLLIQNLAETQKKVLLNRHTSTGIGLPLRDVFASGYYIEPPHKIVSGESLINCNAEGLSEAIDSVLSTENSVVIYGEAGYGKSTILAKCFSDHVDKARENHSYSIPLFLPLRNKGMNYKFDLGEFINDDIKDLLHKKEYPFLNISDIKLRFYLDGFDELSELLSEKDIDRIRKSQIFRYPLVLSCRQRYVYQYLNIHSFSDIFGVRIQMQKWDLDIVEKYVINFFSKKGKENQEVLTVINKIKNSEELQQLLDSPLLITMFIYYLENNLSEEYSVEISRVNLFDNWMEVLSKRESSKYNDVSSDIIMAIWENVAWKLYYARKKNESLHKNDIKSLIKELFPDISLDSAIQSLDSLFEWKSDLLNGTFHEQFMEYLVAKLLVNSTINHEKPYPDYLKIVLRPEINRYIRGIWKQKSKEEKEMIYSSITNQFFNNVGKKERDSISIRVHAAYHMSRLKTNDRCDNLDRAFEVEKDVSVLLSLYFGAIKLGMLDKEEEFYRLLQDPKYSEANRGYHLVYYNDLLKSDSFPYKDDNTVSWAGTLKAFERHFISKEIDHFFLRRIDLYTMKTLIIARQSVEPLTDETVAEFERLIESCLYAVQEEYVFFADKIRTEYEDFLNVYNRYK